MNEIIEAKLKQLGFSPIPEELAQLINELKQMVDKLNPEPIYNQILSLVVLLYKHSLERRKAAEAKKAKE